jgi:hypothetical protein
MPLSRRLFISLAGAVPARAQETREVPIGADRLIWRRSSPDFAIYLPSGYGDRTNQQVVAAATPKGTLIVTWTLGAYESAPDHRQVVSRSTDDGRTWSHPLVLDSQGVGKDGQGDGLRAQYGFPFVVPATGRVYIFYSKNTGQNQVRQDTTAVMKFVYSDDDGLTWRRGGVILLPRCEWSHPDPKADPNWISIYAPILTSRGVVITGAGRYKAGPDLYKGWSAPSRDRQTELVFFRFDNILTESDPAKLTVSVWPAGEKGLRIPRADNAKFFWSNEPSLTELSDGRIFCTIRTRNDSVYYTVSEDGGRSWREPAPLLYTNGGEPVLNPNAPCPVIRLPDGRVVLMFYNRKNGGEREFGARDPVWLSVGRETLHRPQPVEFSQPRMFMDIHNQMAPGGTAWPQIASYSSFLVHKGRLYLFYNDSKYFILGKVVPEELLAH